MDQAGDVQMAENYYDRHCEYKHENTIYLTSHPTQIHDVTLQIVLDEYSTQTAEKTRCMLREEISRTIASDEPAPGQLHQGSVGRVMSNLINRVTGMGPANATGTLQYSDVNARALEVNASVMGTELTDQIDKLSLQLGEKNSEVDSLTQALNYQREDLIGQLHLEQQKTRELNEKLSSFRSMLIKPSPAHVIDSEVISKFGALRGQITRIVMTFFDRELSKEFWSRSLVLTAQQKEFFGPFRNAQRLKKYLVNRVRGKVSDIISEEILDQPSYGLGNEFKSTTDKLEDVERFFLTNLPKSNLKEFVEWRSATRKCGGLLAGRSETAAITAKKIIDFFHPMEMKENVTEKKFRESVFKMCEDTVELRNIMRSARDIFRIERHFDGLLGDHTELVDKEADEHESQVEPDTIAFCIYGALTKRTEETPLVAMTLEKARVVVYRL